MADYERSLTVAAPLSRVWRAFTEVEDLRAWHGFAIEFEARAGGRVLFRAGLRPGDLLVRLGGAPLFGRGDLALVTREHPPGSRLEVAYVRAALLLTGTATLNPRA